MAIGDLYDSFHKTFSTGIQMLYAPGAPLVISQQTENAFATLSKNFSPLFPDMPATVPVHVKRVLYNYSTLGWELHDGLEGFPVWVVYPEWKASK
jgi:hypothetical protein